MQQSSLLVGLLREPSRRPISAIGAASDVVAGGDRR